MNAVPHNISHRAKRFVEANQKSPLVYQSASSEIDTITYRLRDDSRFELSADEARALTQAGFMPRWAHLEGLVAA